MRLLLRWTHKGLVSRVKTPGRGPTKSSGNVSLLPVQMIELSSCDVVNMRLRRKHFRPLTRNEAVLDSARSRAIAGAGRMTLLRGSEATREREFPKGLIDIDGVLFAGSRVVWGQANGGSRN
jgi:hypothetical protein